MATKYFVTLCASLALVNTIAACPWGSPVVTQGWLSPAINSCGLGGYNTIAVDNGGALGLTSVSALTPHGISILSENNINGNLEITGNMPLLAAVAFEGNLPSAGTAGTAYNCGNGNVGISAESLAAAGLTAGAAPATYGLGAANFGNAFTGTEIAGYGLEANAAVANAAYENIALANAGRFIAPRAGCGYGIY